MILIDGKKEAAILREELKKEVLDLKARYNKIPEIIDNIKLKDLATSKVEMVTSKGDVGTGKILLLKKLDL